MCLAKNLILGDHHVRPELNMESVKDQAHSLRSTLKFFRYMGNVLPPPASTGVVVLTPGGARRRTTLASLLVAPACLCAC